MRERDGSARGDSRYYRPHTSDSIRQVAGATNATDDRAVASNFSIRKLSIHRFGPSDCSSEIEIAFKFDY
jgi:hypothetical protein